MDRGRHRRVIPLHATATSDPQQLRFVVPPAHLPPRGVVRAAPDRLTDWLSRKVIDSIVVADSGVLVTLATGQSWRDVGDEIRDALADALTQSGWQVGPATGDDDRVAGIVHELLAGQLGAYAQSHGGTIELVAVNGPDVTVRLSGACRGCPAADSTLTDRLQRELRRRVGDQVRVISDDGSAPVSLGRKLLALLVR
jgi:NFU1 iron-sulfur cluster scaffold homolog, mitochondrial